MGEIEVNEYVRTNKGNIGQVIGIFNGHCQAKYHIQFQGKVKVKRQYLSTYTIINHSKQLIDLIEVKDLVCFKNKLQNSLENEEMIIHIFDNDTLEEVKQAIEKGEIELLEILTHEQYEENSYKVGGEDE